MKSAEHQISGCPAQIFLTLTTVFWLSYRQQDALEVSDMNPGELAARELERKDFKVPESLLAVTTRTLIYNCNTPIIPTDSMGLMSDQHQTGSAICRCLQVWKVSQLVGMLSLIAGMMEMPGIRPNTVILLFSTHLAYSVVAVSHGTFLVLPQEEVTHLKTLDLSHWTTQENWTASFLWSSVF